MIKKTVTYPGLDESEISKDLYFNLFKAELLKLKGEWKGDVVDHLKKVVEKKDNAAMFDVISRILGLAYGERVNNEFIKSQAARDAFVESQAFYALLDSFMDDPDSFTTFVQGLLPKGLDIPQN